MSVYKCFRTTIHNFVEEDILWLDIAVDDIELGRGPQACCGARYDAQCLLRLQLAALFEKVLDCAAFDVLHDHEMHIVILSKIEKPAGIANPKDFRNEVVKFALRARAKNQGKNPSWTSYEKLREVIEKRYLGG